MRTAAIASGLICGFVLTACGGEAITDCEIANGLEPFCDPPGFGLISNPEDLAPLPEYSKAMIISQFGSMDGTKSGRIAAFNPYNGVYRHIFPLDVTKPVQDPKGKRWDVIGRGENWGPESCPGPPDARRFSPHGIDLTLRPDGRTQLAVVNHGREAIELLEILPAGSFSGALWRGCVLAPEGAFFNDVVWLPDGGLLVTHMFERGSTWQSLTSMFGYESGFVYEWQPPDAGFKRVPGTEGAFPNGIEVSHDGREIFLNVYGASEVRRIVRATGEVTAVAQISRPDNVTWNAAGTKLLVASHNGSLLEIIGCGSIESGSCPASSQIVELDPDSFETQVLYETNGAPMGAITVALQRRDDLWLGTFAGDRLGRVWLTPEGKPEKLIAIEEALAQQATDEPVNPEESSP